MNQRTELGVMTRHTRWIDWVAPLFSLFFFLFPDYYCFVFFVERTSNFASSPEAFWAAYGVGELLLRWIFYRRKLKNKKKLLSDLCVSWVLFLTNLPGRMSKCSARSGPRHLAQFVINLRLTSNIVHLPLNNNNNIRKLSSD